MNTNREASTWKCERQSSGCAEFVRAFAPADPICRDAFVDCMTDLADPGQARDNPERPQQRNHASDTQHRIESTITGGGLEDPHLPHDLLFSQPGSEALATSGISSVGEGEPMQPVESMQTPRRSTAHWATAVEKHQHCYLDPARRAASSVAAIMLEGSATPLPAISNAVP